MSKYLGFESRQDFIDSIAETEWWIKYKESTYVFTLDGRGWNCIPQWLCDHEATDEEMADLTVSADTIEELIDKVVLYDGVTLNEALEMDL